ncbi:MAG: heat-shock protein Hsp90 [Methanomicrobiales archaeon]|nr:heat-shock protein Hsp90 [Methanomicrobiales archaeon]
MAKNPYDDAFKDLAKVLEDLLSNLSRDENTRFIGCTIITGAGGEPHFSMMGDPGDRAIHYETVEGKDHLYVTVELPDEDDIEPYAEIKEDSVCIRFAEGALKIDLPCRVKCSESMVSVSHGIMDIVCRKLPEGKDIHTA